MTKDLNQQAVRNSYVDQFKKHLHEIDELSNVVVKGHLILEKGLDKIIKKHVFNTQYIDDAHLSFYRKVQIARAFALGKESLGIWDLILAINSLRNVLAHSLDSEARKKKFDLLKNIYGREVQGADLKKASEQATDKDIALLSCAMCAGFLGEYEYDAGGFRGLVDSMVATLKSRPKKGQ